MLTKEQLIKEEKILYNQFKRAIMNTFNSTNYKQALESEFRAFGKWKMIAQELEKRKQHDLLFSGPSLRSR